MVRLMLMVRLMVRLMMSIQIDEWDQEVPECCGLAQLEVPLRLVEL